MGGIESEAGEVMIGKQWLTIRDKRRRRRLDNEDDLLRAEISVALKQKIPAIPVIVQNAEAHWLERPMWSG